MSLIHEALKKAEQQRQLGEPPTLGTAFATRRRRRPLLPFLSIAIVAALGIGWWTSRVPAPPTPDARQSATTAAPAATPATKGTAAPAASPSNPVAESTAASRKPVMAAGAVPNPNVVDTLAPAPPVHNQAPAPQAPTVRDVAERESESHPDGTNPLAPGESAPTMLAQADPAATDAIDDPDAVQAKSAAKARQSASAPLAPGHPEAARLPAAVQPRPHGIPTEAIRPPAATKPALVSAPPPPPPPQPPAQPPVNAAPASAAAPAPPPPAAVQASQPAAANPPAAAPLESLPMYWQLPFDVRRELPELKLSMHVYSATPAQRFVVVNGVRQVEGDSFGTDVKLVEIRSDGAVLEFHGQRFLLPRGGS
ncbi:general secretion pathway protein GspB [Tahibacter amnicola]|uniref:General secretion pathway protein GspB n=1 Tax=Tahibacter amnicola TaxID=2976241 RepID=A0ABY6BHS4_9GAMM|nr:general secretion pathway protein GspB [Tahibacter amnicola]UXI68630.1 general secretion pathway protein GspB [Tahibacter amnicola]